MTETEKPRKLIFHIGHHKTGTTSIQNAFARKEIVLEEGNILYPARTSHNYLPAHVEAYAHDGTVLPGTPARPGLQAIAERLQTEPFDFAVISGEQFEGVVPRDVHKALHDHWLEHVTDYSVICYLRPHAARIMSSFAELVKLGNFSGTPEEFFDKTLANQRFFFFPKLSGWDDQFEGHFKLRPMIRSELVGGSLLQDFVETAFGPDARVRIDAQSAANESLCLEDLLVLKLVQRCLKPRDRKLRAAMGWEMAMAFAAKAREGGTGTKVLIHKALAERIRTTYLDDAQAIETRFFGGKPLLRTELDRAVDEALPEAQSFEPADHFSPDALRGFSLLGEQINRLLDHDSGSWSEFLSERRYKLFLGEDPSVPSAKVGRPKREGARPGRKLARRKLGGKGKGQGKRRAKMQAD